MRSWVDTLTEVKTETQAIPPERVPNRDPVTCTEDVGVMLMYRGFGWGVESEDGHELVFNWVDPIDAIIYKGHYVKKPEDVFFSGAEYYRKELEKGTIVPVRRVTTVEVLG